MNKRLWNVIHNDDVVRKRLAKLIAHDCFRNTKLEDFHADPDSRLSDAEMKELMVDVVNHTYGFVIRLFRGGGSGTTTIQSLAFIYDAIGNITNKSDQGTYTYNDDGYNNPHAADSINSVDLSYDNVGNVTTYGSDSFGWNYRDRMISSVVGGNTTLYAYDHNNLRVLKGDGTSTTTYPNKFHNVDGATTTNHVFLPDGTLLATIESTANGTTTNYIHTDHLGGTNVITDQEGLVVEVTDYYPFGEQRISSTTDTPEQRKFTGHEYDTDSDLTYAKARYYDQNIAKFLSIDPVGRDNPGQFLTDPQQLNLYSYSRNNPLRFLDITGEKLFEISAGLTAGPFGWNLGFRYEPGVGRQLFSSNSVGVGIGASLRYDPIGTLNQERRPGEVYVERQLTVAPGVGGYWSKSADENPLRPWSLSDNPNVSSGWAFGLEAGYTHSFVRDGAIRYSNNYTGAVNSVATQVFAATLANFALSSATERSSPLSLGERLQNSISALANFFTQMSEAQSSGAKFDPFASKN